jgi:hypothetical protein
MAVEARFYVAEVSKTGYGGSASSGGNVKLQATTRKDESTRKFWQATPSGQIQMSLSAEGEGALHWFDARIGKSVRVTFEDVDPDE